MRRYSQRQSLSSLSEINITPLLDLAFVLLIIFMITTPLLESNVTLIAIAHVVLIVGLIRWSRASSNTSAQSVVWLNGGGGDGVVAEKKNPPTPVKSPSPRKESKTDALKEREPDEDRPYLASAPSDIQLPTPKPSP